MIFVEPNQLPGPTPELVLIGVMLEAQLFAMPRKQRARLLARIDARMNTLVEPEGVVVLRPGGEIPAVTQARRRAAAWWGRLGPLLAQRL